MENMDWLQSAVEKHRTLILEAERYIWKNPETGYKEVKTTAYLAKKFEELGYTLTMAEGITGFYTVIDTGRKGPTVLILAELDSVICASHPEADKTTGAVHSCGHNAQCAALLGIAAALKEDKILEKLSGKIQLCAVPAEELLEIEYRMRLKEEGKIRYLGGKSEFLSRGYFDGVDVAFMVHTGRDFRAMKGAVGCLAKKIIYKGFAAHAGGAPHFGKNALYAANCGLNAINALRETFVDDDHIRVHPIITAGGSMVNAIPDRVTMESYVRGKTYDAIVNANKSVNRALCGAALSLNNNVEIVDIPGYAPLVNDQNMIDVAKEAADLVLHGTSLIVDEAFSTGSTDMGDLSCIMPVIHPYAPGADGSSHGSDYQIVDPEKACVENAKWQLAMLYLLLKDGGVRAQRIKEAYQPLFASKEEFFAYQDSLFKKGDRIVYREDGTALVSHA